MKKLLILCLVFVGCEEPQVIYNPPGASGYTEVLDIPKAYRVKNYAGGSCVYASTSCSLHTGGKHDLAKWVRANHSGAAYATDVMKIYDDAGLKYTYGEGMDFLRACHARRLPSLIGWPRGHVVNFVGIDSQYVWLIDNNSPDEYTRIPINEFRNEWQGWCVALVEKSIPPSLVQRNNQ